MKRVLGLAAAASVLSACLVAVSPVADAAAKGCTVTGYGPESGVIDYAGSYVTFSVESKGCGKANWTLEVPGINLVVPQKYASAYVETEADCPGCTQSLDNDEAGKHDVVIKIGGTTKKYNSGLDLERATGFDARKPTVHGTKLTMKAYLSRTDWYYGGFAPYGKRHVKLQFKADGTHSYVTKATGRTDKHGNVSATVTDKAAGLWRWRYVGNDAAGSANTESHHVARP